MNINKKLRRAMKKAARANAHAVTIAWQQGHDQGFNEGVEATLEEVMKPVIDEVDQTLAEIRHERGESVPTPEIPVHMTGQGEYTTRHMADGTVIRGCGGKVDLTA